MAEYIEREALIKALKERYDYIMQYEQYYSKEQLWHEILSYAGTLAVVDKLPVADAVEVVRCKDCKYYGFEIRPSTGKHACLNYMMPYCKLDDFCSYGERRNDA